MRKIRRFSHPSRTLELLRRTNSGQKKQGWHQSIGMIGGGEKTMDLPHSFFVASELLLDLQSTKIDTVRTVVLAIVWWT